MQKTYYDHNTLITVGKHKGKRIREIPVEYLINIHPNKHFSDKQLLFYIEENLELLKNIQRGVAHFPEPIKREPCKKTVYPTKQLARKALKTIRGSSGDHKKPIRSYQCDDCSGWHLTSLPIEKWKGEQEKKGNQKTAS